MPERAHRILIVLSLAAACVSLALLSGCGTVRGVGEDISAAGQTLADAADDSDRSTR